MAFPRSARLPAGVILASLGLMPGLVAQQDGEVQILKEKVSNLETEVHQLKDQQAADRQENDESFDDVQQQVTGVAGQIAASKPGSRKFVITGYADAGYENKEDGTSTFSTAFNPIFLWKISDRLFAEGEVEFELEDGETAVGLEYAQLSYVLCDYLTLGAGKFLNPANAFINWIHPAWINRLPDKPMAFGSNKIMPSTQLGVQLHGAAPVGPTTVNYAVYVSNGPSLVTDDPAGYGKLDFKNFSDTNNNKAVGGRIGVRAIPELEFGYSFEYSQVDPDGSGLSDTDARIQSVDAGYTDQVPGGTLQALAQWAFSDVDDVTFDPTGSMGFGPVMLNNNRNGGYAQLAYRPSESTNDIVKNLEGVVRYDAINLPNGAPEGVDRRRVTFGLNYWTGPSSVFKVAYQVDDRDRPAKDVNALLLQFAIGF